MNNAYPMGFCAKSRSLSVKVATEPVSLDYVFIICCLGGLACGGALQ
jgi:hypothetical protein